MTMKKTYIAPQSKAVTLFTEEALLSASKVLNVDENKSINGDDARSAGFEWSNTSWEDE